MPILRGCCCFDLKTGATIIGAVFLVLEVLGFLGTATAVATLALFEDIVINYLNELRDHNVKNRNSFNNIFLKANDVSNNIAISRSTEERLQNENQPTEFDEMYSYIADNLYLVKMVLVGILIFQLLDIIVSSCLIHGLRKKFRGMLLPFIMLQCLFIIIELATLVLIITVYAYLGHFHIFFIVLIIVQLIWLSAHIYLILVVISEYQALGLIRMHEELCMK